MKPQMIRNAVDVIPIKANADAASSYPIPGSVDRRATKKGIKNDSHS
jgi:hypothetical protein